MNVFCYQEEKVFQINTVQNLTKRNEEVIKVQLRHIQQVAIANQNIFEALMDACKVCSLGQITAALFEVGGQYRRNM